MSGIRRAIKRFSGSNEFSDKAFISIFEHLLEIGNIDGAELVIPVGKDPRVSAIEKMDGMFAHIGVTLNNEVYMATSGGDFIVGGMTHSKFLPEISFLEASNLCNHIRAMSIAQNAPIRIACELFSAVKGDVVDDTITFNVVPYSREMIGRAGAVVIFDIESYDVDSNRWAPLTGS